LGTIIRISAVDSIDGHRNICQRDERNVFAVAGIGSGDARAAYKKSEGIIELVDIFMVFFRTKYIPERDGVGLGNEVKFKHAGIKGGGACN
jgi:hypothetical protein